ncbi:hypothetical protein HY450_01870 [Candidatus Pacearchaeota archaeon]|nr:hypothetical protein [Candidatus Pacearchaeota archaeon]
MALDISINSPEFIFLVVLFLVIAAIIVLSLIERRLTRKVETHSHSEIFLRKLRLIERQPSNEAIENLDKLSRTFLAHRYGVNHSAQYSELIEKFIERKNIRAADYCESMQRVLYSGSEINKERIIALSKRLETFIMEQKRREKTKETQKQKLRYLSELFFKLSRENKNLNQLRHFNVESELKQFFTFGKRFHQEYKERNHKPRKINVVQHTVHKINYKKVRHRKKEPFHHRHIRSIDDMERVKYKLNTLRNVN